MSPETATGHDHGVVMELALMGDWPLWRLPRRGRHNGREASATIGFDTWQRGIHRTSCRILAAFVLVVVTLQLRLLVGQPYDLRLSAVTAFGVVVLMAAAYRGWRGLLDHRDVWAFAVLVVLAAAQPAGPVAGRPGTGGDQNPAFFILATTLLVCIVTIRGVAVVGAVTSATAAYVLASVVAGDRTLSPVLDEAIILATSQVAIAILFRQLTNEALRADQAHHRAVGEQEQAARRRAEQDATIHTQRTLHDHVLAALSLLRNHSPRAEDHQQSAIAAGAFGPLSRATIRAECRRAAHVLAALDDDLARPDMIVNGDALGHRLCAEAQAATASTGVTARVSYGDPSAREVLLHLRVADAMCDAVAESLRNVGRHAGVHEADIVVSVSRSGEVVVEVADQGPGLHPGSVSGFGLRLSVTARLREVGGDARIDSSSAGTRVVLSWQPSAAASESAPTRAYSDPEPELTRIPSHPRIFAAGFSATLLSGSLYLAARYPTAGASRWWDAALCVSVVLYIIWCIAAVSQPRGLRHAHQAGFVIIPTLLAVGLYVAGDGSLRGFDCWIVGLCGIPVVLLAMVRPAIPVMAFAVIEGAVVATAAVLDPTLAPLDVLAPITQTVMFAGLVVYGVSAIQRVRRAAETEERSLSTAVTHRQAIDARQRIQGSYNAWLSAEVRPFLEAVADAELDPDDDTVQLRAGVLALAVRDELAVPAQLPDGVRQLIATARERGVGVRMRAVDDSRAASHDELEALLRLLTSDETLTDLTISLPQPSSALRVVTRPRLSPQQQQAVIVMLGEHLQEIHEDDLVSIITFHPHPRESP